MRKLSFYNPETSEKWVQISRMTAKRLFLAGKTIAICASNLRPFSPWHCEFLLNRNCYTEMVVDEIGMENMFYDRINSYEYYNCTCHETGKYACFYVRESDR